MTDTTGLAPDRSLIERIGQGDASALRDLEGRYGMTLFALAYRTLRDPMAADDIVTSVIADAMAYASVALTQPECILTWLVQLARIHIAGHPARSSYLQRGRLSAAQARIQWLRAGQEPLTTFA